MTASASPNDERSKKPEDITEKEINDAQESWCKGLVEISRAFRSNRNYRELANKFIDDLYDFDRGQTFFRPTLATAPYNFRTTKEGALAYFIGENPRFPDEGFAKLKWEHAWYDNKVDEIPAIQLHGNIGIAMGHVFLSDEEIGGTVTTVDKTFVYRKDKDKSIRLIVHMSAKTNEPTPEDPNAK